MIDLLWNLFKYNSRFIGKGKKLVDFIILRSDRDFFNTVLKLQHFWKHYVHIIGFSLTHMSKKRVA